MRLAGGRSRVCLTHRVVAGASVGSNDVRRLPVLARLVPYWRLSGAGGIVVPVARPIAGVRTALTLSSDAAWYPAQRAAAPKTRVAAWGPLAGGAALVALGLLSMLFGASVVVYVVLTFGSAGWLLGWVLAGAGDAQRAVRDAVART